MGFKPVNVRICTLKIKTKFFNLTLINVRAHKDDCEEEIKEEFYQELEAAYDSAPFNGTKTILFALNAKVGKEMEYGVCTGANSLYRMRVGKD